MKYNALYISPKQCQSFGNLQELDSIEHGFSCYNKFFWKYEKLISASDDFSDFMHN